MSILAFTENETLTRNPSVQVLQTAEVLLTVREVAEILRVPVSWVYERTRRRGKERLPHMKMGKYLRFRSVEIEQYLETLRRE